MKKVNATGKVAIALGLLLLAVPLAAACAKPAPAPAQAPSPALAPKPAPVSKSSPLDAIIEGAKKEGAVSVTLSSKFGITEILRALEKAIRDKYGVNLNITWTGSGGMAGRVAAAIMETKTGAAPTFDLLRLSTAYIPAGMKEGAFERVDWKPLLADGAPPEIVLQHPDLRGSIVSESSNFGLMYNRQKVSAAEVPKKLSDLADPKWKGRLGIIDYAADWVKWAFILGKDKTYATMRSIMNNNPIKGTSPTVNNRFLIGEIDLVFGPDTNLMFNKEKGMPMEWRSLDFVDIKEYPMVVQTRAVHPNAAKLVAIYLASPDGMKFVVERVQGGSHYFPGNYIYDSLIESRKEGVPVYGTVDYPGLLDFLLSPEFDVWGKEIDLMLKGAG